jgi:ubiquinone/menaquinone biosynthesis C-methylase UbiE
MLALREYSGVDKDDPIRFYTMPFIGNLYRKRVEKCLLQLSGGSRVLEIGFGSGVTFLDLSEMYEEIHGVDLVADAESVMAAFEKLGVRTFLKKGNLLDLPYRNGYFDSVLLISTLEHLKPESLIPAFREVWRVLKHDGEVVYGVPVEKMIMDCAFRFLGYNIKEYHFSNQKQIAEAAKKVFKESAISGLRIWPFGKLYEIGRFIKDETAQMTQLPGG